MSSTRRVSFLGDTWRAHALMFERPLRPDWDEGPGGRIFVAFLLVAVAVFYGLRYVLFSPAGATAPMKLAFVSALTVAFIVAHRWLVRLPFTAIGLKAARDWTRRETLYLVQVGIAAAIVFAMLFRDHFAAMLALGMPDFLVMIVTGLVWGAVQEFLYRGWLQSELTRRFGAIAGVVVANVVFTFGPLHTNWLMAPGGVQWGMVGAIFVIGLIFGVIYQRSGNLWIPAVLHGLWPANMG